MGRICKRIIIVLLLTLAVTELFLRAFGLFLTYPTDVKNEILNADANKLRVLALGESTTADFYSFDDPNASWPRQLETKLQESGISARIYNEGVTGTETAYVASRLRHLLELYKPHIVISMLGTNDRPNGLKYEESVISELRLLLSHIRIFRLGNLLLSKLGKSSCDFDSELIQDTDIGMALDAAKMAISDPVTLVESHIRNTIRDDHRVALILLNVARAISGKKVSWAESDGHRPFIDRAFDLYPLNSRIIGYTLEFKKDLDPSVRSISDRRFLEVSEKLLNCANTLPSNYLVIIADHALNKKLNLKGQFQNFSFVKKSESLLAYHYRLIDKMLNENHILHLAMQYPTLPISELQNLFSDDPGKLNPDHENIKFVSNQENFYIALRTAPYEKYFIDRFGTTWGHATKAGNSLIADAAKTAVIETVNSKSELHKFKK